MFQKRKASAPQKRIDSLIGAGTVVDGHVTFTGGLRIDGVVNGAVKTTAAKPGTLVVSEDARVVGEICVSHVVINGAVEGPVRADDYLELQAKARVNGEIAYRSLEMHVGAVVQGRLVLVDAPETASIVELKRVSGKSRVD